MQKQLCTLFLLLFFASACEDIEKDFTRSDSEVVDTNMEVTDTTGTNDPIDPRDCWDENTIALHNETFNELFTRYEDGWTGGDATYSIPIDETTNLWIFGDTFLGRVNEDRSRPGSPLINNSIVLQSGNDVKTYFGGTESKPRAFVEPPEEDWWYWPGHGQMHDGQIQLVLFAMKRAGEGMWGFDYAAIDLAVISYPEMEVVSLERKMEFKGANFGACLLQYEGYTYLYAAYKSGFSKFLHVARVEGTDLREEWEYFNSPGTWVGGVENSAPIFSNVSEQFSVIHRPEGFYLMTQNYALGNELYMYKSESLTGPFEDRKTVYCTPESNDQIFTYNAFVHEQLSTNDTLLISYNNNSRVFADLFRNADNYRPHFVNISGWK
jgi:hypothetical protein